MLSTISTNNSITASFMQVFTTVSETQKQIENWQSNGLKIGFVPTMGALHAGHISLVKQSLEDNDRTVVSVFVNPNQFNNAADLEKYPRTFDRDSEMLRDVGVDLMFFPSVNEIYPTPDIRKFDFGDLEKVMEGEHRPGHFNGVAQVVSRLFEIVMPDNAYFGEKDFQQLAIINAMVKQLALKVKIVPCTILREANGLAMSSRNERLNTTDRENAKVIYETLKQAKEELATNGVEVVKKKAIERLNSSGFLKAEYLEISEAESLKAANKIEAGLNYIICLAVWLGDVRLIDNVRA